MLGMCQVKLGLTNLPESRTLATVTENPIKKGGCAQLQFTICIDAPKCCGVSLVRLSQGAHVPESLSFPTLVINRLAPRPSIEVDNDAIEGKYASGGWEDLIPTFTAAWVRKKQFGKSATVWTWSSPSVSFGHLGYSVFIAQFGLPKAYFDELERHLGGRLGSQVRFSDYVQPSLQEGWLARVHVQDGQAWRREDEAEWSKVVAHT